MISPNTLTADLLKEVDDEVKDLHPILHALFRKMPGVSHVEYTQGPSEMGADFILHRHDEALMRTHHIGVVAKVGQIRQNTTEVERQIKECFVPRKGGDSTTINIKEVWVVSTREITQNARDVLAKQYADQKIEFISGQSLATLIDKHDPGALVTLPPGAQDYASTLVRQIDDEERRSTIVALDQKFYVEPGISSVAFDGYGKKRRRKAIPNLRALLEKLYNSPLSIIQAGPGGGKSEASRQLVRMILESPSFTTGKILPCLTSAASVSKRSLPRLICDARGKAELPTAPVIVFIDGFDELDLGDAKRGDLISSWLEEASENGQVHLVLLSRPFDEAAVLRSRLQSTDMYRIEPLRGTQAIKFIDKVAGEGAATSRLITDLTESLLVRALEGAPIAYILLGKLVLENEQDLPSNLTELFQKYVEITMGRWEISKGFRSQREYEVLIECLAWLAGYMLDSELTEVGITEIEAWITAYCKDRGIEVEAGSLARRACERDSILYLRDNYVVGFRHRAFAEFFYAMKMKRAALFDVRPDMYSPYWVNSYYFYVGMFKDCPDLLESFLEQSPESEQEKWARVAHFGLFLLAAYLTPTRVSTTAIVKLVGEISELYIRACDPKSGSVFSQLPTMQLLCVISHSFRRSYGYKFFRGALEEAIFELEEKEHTEETAIALFLLATAYREAGGELRFDELIEKFGSSLPLVVKMAIGHEAERMKATSDLMTRMERNLRRTFKGNRSSGVFLKNLYDMPVSRLEKKLLQ